MKRWEEYRNCQPSTAETTQDLPLSKYDLWVEANLNNKGCVYGFGVEGLVMNQRAQRSFFVTQSSSVNNYDPREMVQRLTESVYKAVNEARAQETRQKIEVELMPKLSVQFNNERAQKEAILKKRNSCGEGDY